MQKDVCIPLNPLRLATVKEEMDIKINQNKQISVLKWSGNF